jgi:hypothetical protein
VKPSYSVKQIPNQFRTLQSSPQRQEQANRGDAWHRPKQYRVIYSVIQWLAQVVENNYPFHVAQYGYRLTGLSASAKPCYCRRVVVVILCPAR